jgi:hypothetical protein
MERFLWARKPWLAFIYAMRRAVVRPATTRAVSAPTARAAPPSMTVFASFAAVGLDDVASAMEACDCIRDGRQRDACYASLGVDRASIERYLDVSSSLQRSLQRRSSAAAEERNQVDHVRAWMLEAFRASRF